MTEPKTITEDELAGALARREPDLSREDAGRLSRTLLADVRAHREPPGEPLSDAQCDRYRQLTIEWGKAVTAVKVALGYAAHPHVAPAEIIAAAWDGLGMLSGEEAGGACACGQEECRG